jgi:hypothetical protein
MLEQSFILVGVEWQRMDIGLLDLLLYHVLGVLFMLSPVLVGHPLELLKVTSVIFQVFEVRLFVRTDNARDSQLLFHFDLQLLEDIVWCDMVWQVTNLSPVSCSKCVDDRILFLISKFIEHR